MAKTSRLETASEEAVFIQLDKLSQVSHIVLLCCHFIQVRVHKMSLMDFEANTEHNFR